MTISATVDIDDTDETRAEARILPGHADGYIAVNIGDDATLFLTAASAMNMLTALNMALSDLRKGNFS